MQQTLYEILGVESDANNNDIRKAYKAMLLETHPDKSGVNNDSKTLDITVNAIQHAFRTLIDEKSRKIYDEQLAESFKKQGFHNTGEGLDTYSLDSFNYEEESGFFTMSCPRCQMTEGFQLTEDILEEYAISHDNNGYFVLVQCSACSLWLKVLFDIADEE